jgi:hypothetical protein
MKRIHITSDYGIEGWVLVPRWRGWVPVVLAVGILVLAGGAAGWMLGAAQTLAALR